MVVPSRLDLLQRYPLLKRVLASRAFQPALTFVTLLVFVLAILAGLVGTPVGSRNFGTIFVWIVWWALLIVLLVPMTGRFWCSICPIPAPGEWRQRRGIVQHVGGKLRSLHLRWPNWLKNMWAQNIGFLLLGTFSVVILTTPGLSSAILLGLMLLGFFLSTLYDNRVFCRYICPVSGFIGLYALAAPVELRVKEAQICITHTSKDCLTGGAQGYGCAWMTYPATMRRNTNCSLCMECLRSCPKDNIGLFVRPLGQDLLVADKPRLDEAYKALIMLASALLYSIVLGGPWGVLKDWASVNSLPNFAVYALGFWAINLLIVPGLFAGTVIFSHRFSRAQLNMRALVCHFAKALVPLGLAAWIAFSLGFVFTNASYIAVVLSDPFGWGWDLFGTANIIWRPLFAGFTSFLQAGILIAGLIFALRIAHGLAKQLNLTPRFTFGAWLPVAAFLFASTSSFLWVYLG